MTGATNGEGYAYHSEASMFIRRFLIGFDFLFFSLLIVLLSVLPFVVSNYSIAIFNHFLPMVPFFLLNLFGNVGRTDDCFTGH